MRAVGLKTLKNRLSEYVRLATNGETVLAPPVLARALEPFPSPVRTLDALHLASMEFLRAHGQIVNLASYDDRLRAAARALRIPLYKL